MQKFVLSSVLLFAAMCNAQSSDKGNLSGTVIDSAGWVVPGVTVTVVGTSVEKSDSTNADGQFLFSLLAPGKYSLSINKPGYTTVNVKQADVETGKTSSIRVPLVKGDSSETLHVMANAIVVDTTSTAVSSSDCFCYNPARPVWESVPVERSISGILSLP